MAADAVTTASGNTPPAVALSSSTHSDPAAHTTAATRSAAASGVASASWDLLPRSGDVLRAVLAHLLAGHLS